MNPELVLADTSAWLMALGRLAVPGVVQRLRELIRQNRLATTPIVRLELLAGARSETEFQQLRDQLDGLHLLPINEPEWAEAARLAFDLRRAGKTAPHTDALIATAAKRAGAVLLHADHHFDYIAEITGLAVESLVPLVKKLSSNPGS
ncbi:MAG: PIN domain-containing protein [Chloroflexi bacterium]|nr:PIN domain-containing protein [Chloroflexota bacterium]